MTRFTRREFAGATLGSAVVLAGASVVAPAVVGAAKPRLVVIGGGPGGATVARYVAKASPDIDVTLINGTASFSTCFFSNLYVGGFRSFESITHSYDRLVQDYGIKVLIDWAVAIDGAAKQVTLARGGSLGYDKLVVAPGIDFRFDAIDGYGPEAIDAMPHAWQAGEQTVNLKRQLLDMEDGGTFVICPPPNPFRCPPGPYERVSMVAHYFKHHKPRSKILILDAKDKFSKQGLFQQAWSRFYPERIEWLPAEITGGGVRAVDPGNRQVITEDETFVASVANVIPPQQAGRIAGQAGLADESGWCPVQPATLESKLVPDIHLVGDAIIPGDMPKSGFSANSQAKVCAQALLAALIDKKAFKPRFRNTCWSLVTTDHGIKVGANYEATEEKIAKIEGFISDENENDEVRAETAREANGWYDGITKDIFG